MCVSVFMFAVFQVTEDLFDYGKLGAVGPEVVMQAADLLMADFRMLSCQDIKWALNALKGHYAITRKVPKVPSERTPCLLCLLCCRTFQLSLALPPRPYVKLWRSGKSQGTRRERNDGVGPRNAATSISTLSTVRKLLACTCFCIFYLLLFCTFRNCFHKPLETLSNWFLPCPPGSVKFDKRMYFLENDRRYCRTYSSLEASVQKELSFYQQKAKEWAEVHTQIHSLGHSVFLQCCIYHDFYSPEWPYVGGGGVNWAQQP